MKRFSGVILFFLAILVSAETMDMPDTDLQIVDATNFGCVSLNFAALRYGGDGGSVSLTRCDGANALRGLEAGKFHIALVDEAVIGADFGGKIIPAFYEVLVGYVHLSNAVTDVRQAGISEVWRGVRPGWSALGGNASDIHRYGISSGKNGSEMIESFLKIRTPGRGIVGLNDTAEAILYVSRDPAALALARYQEEFPGESVRMLSVGGIPPSRQNIENGKYPLRRRYVWAVAASAPEAARKFLPYLSGDEFYRALLAEDLLPAR